MAVVTYLQVRAFRQNRTRIAGFGSVFSRKETFSVLHDNSGMASAISGQGNGIFKKIIHAVNSYLGSLRGSYPDFVPLKDAVDRNCHAAEDEIGDQMFTPLYYGLTATMGGVVVSLAFMLGGETFPTPPEGASGQNFGVATGGLGGLLTSMVIAMASSVAGIFLTTKNMRLLKEKKRIEEREKNDFMAWMQTNLFPARPVGVGGEPQYTAASLNRFSATLAENNGQLKETITKIGSLLQEQGETLKQLHDSNMQTTASANAKTLQELQECTARLEDFNNYLAAVGGYATEIRKFREQLAKEQERLCVLEEIRDFFRDHGYKDALAKAVSDSDDSLRTALRNLQATTSDSMETMSHTLASQTDTFRQISQEMQGAFEAQLRHFPQLETQIGQIATIPALLEKLAKEIESSNTRMANSVNYALQNIRVELNGENAQSGQKLPAWLPALLAAIALFAAMPYILKVAELLKETF